jgi:hypothetical protein
MSFPQQQSAQQALVESVQAQANFLRRTCKHCDTEILLEAGDVLFGEKWYHRHCWERLRSASIDESKSELGTD